MGNWIVFVNLGNFFYFDEDGLSEGVHYYWMFSM